ncbi:MAG: bifunctional oligoribonuclease/PAP phosphatase NrnA [Anaerolineae bacterium]|jgi:phosphoesterase RecJ-like protein|nr:bifunctional oligoribonuclease/PAP phosphatase NrnA [Anaerolineae bacterium]
MTGEARQAGIKEQIQKRFESAVSVAVVSHIRPDGDAIGSVLGLGTALEQAGKRVQLILEDGASSAFKELANYQNISKQIEKPVDLVVVVDCSDLERTGESLNGLPVDINIDHHPTNTQFGTINCVLDSSAATAQIITENLEDWGLTLTAPVAEALMAGILTDTIGFRTSNTSGDTLQAASKLIDTGIDMPLIYNQVLLDRSFESVKIWGRGIENLQRNGRIAWTTLDKDDRKAAKYIGKDDSELTSLLSTIKDIDVILVFITQDNGKVKVSWRAKPGLDISQIAVHFGGGGHAPAAGATIEGELDEVIAKVLVETKRVIR